MMNSKPKTKIIRQGKYIAEIEITLTYTDEDWSPYLSLEEAEKLDNLRLALQNNDLKTATQLAHALLFPPMR